ncbi:MAG: 8-oxoguanine deaminase [Chloroflexi bacterium]|nr:8-oxoguanine deaminase [Chloroflexota bacterium]MCY4246989.1 8-oxoguanine deaminase [Chloroflexota bacterium]
MTTMLLKNIQRLATMDAERGELSNAWLLAQDKIIIELGAGEAPATADRVIDLSRHVVLPGLINTHHHMFQSLTRVLAQQGDLFAWLRTCYPIWAQLRAEHVYTAAKLAMAELLLSGCTTASDHHYVFPNDVQLEDEIRAAQELGIRLHAARGSMSVGESAGGLPPDHLVEDEDDILRDTRRLIETWHDPAPQSMLQIVAAPCSPFSVSVDLMRESAALARAYGAQLHTHLAETADDVAYSLERFGLRPGDYAEAVGWVGDDVWHAHCVKLDSAAIDLFARTGTGVCHCPSSNMRLASGIAPVRTMLDRGVPVGLGVDGSASNDSGHLLGEARQAMLLQRVLGGPASFSAREALEVATVGGARVLGRDDIGRLAPGMSADLIAFRLDDIALAGALSDPLAALVFCQPQRVDLSIINGRIVVEDGRLLTVDAPSLVAAHNKLSMQLIRGER